VKASAEPASPTASTAWTNLTDADLPTERWQHLHRRWATGEL
jgi:hypothetical protein